MSAHPSLACRALTCRPSLPPRRCLCPGGGGGGGRALPGGPSEDKNSHDAVYLSRPPASPSRASSRPCLWPWTSSLRTGRSSRRACDLAPPSAFSVSAQQGGDRLLSQQRPPRQSPSPWLSLAGQKPTDRWCSRSVLYLRTFKRVLEGEQPVVFSVLKDDHLSSVSLCKEPSRCPYSSLAPVDWAQNADKFCLKKMTNVSFIEAKQKLHCLK